VAADRTHSVVGADTARPGAGVRRCRAGKMPDAGDRGRSAAGATPQTGREPIGAGAIVVDGKSGSTLYLRALGRLMQGGLHA
jgi:hypothetical protein